VGFCSFSKDLSHYAEIQTQDLPENLPACSIREYKLIIEVKAVACFDVSLGQSILPFLRGQWEQ
jgi:hypothetical protein